MGNRINTIIDNYKPKTAIKNEDKKIIFSMLNEIRITMLDFYVHYNTFSKLTKRYQLQRLDKVLSKYSQHCR